MLREVKTLRRRCRYARTEASLNEHITPQRTHSALTLCVFDKGDSTRAAMCLGKSMLGHHSGAFGLAVIRETVDRLCLVAQDSEYLPIDEGTTHEACMSRKDATLFMADSSVCGRVAYLNAIPGVAPSSSYVHARVDT